MVFIVLFLYSEFVNIDLVYEFNFVIRCIMDLVEKFNDNYDKIKKEIDIDFILYLSIDEFSVIIYFYRLIDCKDFNGVFKKGLSDFSKYLIVFYCKKDWEFNVYVLLIIIVLLFDESGVFDYNKCVYFCINYLMKNVYILIDKYDLCEYVIMFYYFDDIGYESMMLNVYNFLMCFN